jgi:phosphate transport system protein
MAEDLSLTHGVTARPAAGAPHEHHGWRDFDADIRILRAQLTAMAGRCRDQLHRALEATKASSEEKAEDVRNSDPLIDQDEKSIDALLLRILALRQPLASDLRLVTASFKVVTDIERIGDEAVDLAGVQLSPSVVGLSQLAAATVTMLDSAVKSFLTGDRDLAAKVLQADRAARCIAK